MGAFDTLAVEPPAAKAVERPTLLIVDDEPGPRESLRIVFKDRYHCVIATCGREGIEYARTHVVDAAILDIKMPDLTGVDVLRELKEIDPDTECVMLTGYETIETARAAVRYGAADYLNKPFDVDEIRLVRKCPDTGTDKRGSRARVGATQSGSGSGRAFRRRRARDEQPTGDHCGLHRFARP